MTASRNRVVFRKEDGSTHEVHAVPLGRDARAYARELIARFGDRFHSYVIEPVRTDKVSRAEGVRSADEAKKANAAAMGDELGEVYSALWQTVAVAHHYWSEYVSLFGAGPERIALLNQAAPSFFHMLQEQLWESSLLQLTRATDPATSSGRTDRTNLSIRALPALIADPILKAKVEALVHDALERTKFARDWRDRQISHCDLKLALGQETKPVADASRKQVKDALKAIEDVLNAIQQHYFKSQTLFDLADHAGGVASLLNIVDLGLNAQEGQQKGFESE